MTTKPRTIFCSPVYFPFTYIAAPLVEALSFCFRGLVLYQPVGSTCVVGLRPWVDKGFLDVRTPFAGITDKKILTAELKNWKTWGFLNQDADLSYLKKVRGRVAPVEPMTPRVASEIKGMSSKTQEEFVNRDLAFQLFLLLAEDFDRQSVEVARQLVGIKEQRHALQAFFRIDNAEESGHLVSEDLIPEFKEDLGALMTKKRVAAWNHLFQKDPVEPGVLLTDSPASYAFLLDSAKEKVEALKFEVPSVQKLPDQTPWEDQKDYLYNLFHDLVTKPWNDQLRSQIGQARRQIEAVGHGARKPTPDPGEDKLSFHWYLVPQVDTCALLSQGCGLDRTFDENRGARNVLVGLVEHGRI